MLLNICIQTDPVTVGADVTVYVWFYTQMLQCLQMHLPLQPLQPSQARCYAVLCGDFDYFWHSVHLLLFTDVWLPQFRDEIIFIRTVHPVRGWGRCNKTSTTTPILFSVHNYEQELAMGNHGHARDICLVWKIFEWRLLY